MSNFKSTVNKYGDNKYRVDFSYISQTEKDTAPAREVLHVKKMRFSGRERKCQR